MVPILTPASILEEPSSGSKTTQYFPRWRPSIKIGSSFSSEIKTLVFPQARKELIIISFERMSNFFWSSPCTLAVPAAPIKLSKLALRTFVAMNLQVVYKQSQYLLSTTRLLPKLVRVENGNQKFETYLNGSKENSEISGSDLRFWWRVLLL